MEKDSTKEKIKIEDITLAHLKKVVHLIMTKFYDNDGYRHSDLIRKIIRKLKCDYSIKAASRVRYQLRNWIISNNEIVKFGKIDSKKGILSSNSKQRIIKTQNKNKINPRNVNNLDVNILDDENDKSIQDDVAISNSEKQSDNNEVLVSDPENTIPKTQVCNCACGRKRNTAEEVIVKHELIDLTIDDNLVKTEDDEDMYDINTVCSQLDDYYVQPSFIYLVHLH